MDNRRPDFAVMSLNLRFGTAEDGKNRWDLRKKRFDSLFKKFPVDFYGFQEANAFQIEYLRGLLPKHRHIGKRAPAPSFWQNNVIFYPEDWTCLWFDHFFLSPTPDFPSRFFESRWPRQCTIGLFSKKDRFLVCGCTHFDFTTEVQTKSARIVQHRLFKKSVNAPIVLMGDFNATPESSCHLQFTDFSTTRPEKYPLFKNAFAPDYPGTFHGFSGVSDGRHIDWILYRGDIAPLNSAVITEAFDGGYPSDHFPLLVSFRWDSREMRCAGERPGRNLPF